MQSEKQVRLRFFDVAKNAMLRHLGATGEWKTGSEQCSAWFYCLAEVLKFEREEHETIQSWVTRAYVYHFPEKEKPMDLNYTSAYPPGMSAGIEYARPKRELTMLLVTEIVGAADRLKCAALRLSNLVVAAESPAGNLPRRVTHAATADAADMIVRDISHQIALVERMVKHVTLEPDCPPSVGDKAAFAQGFYAGVKAAESNA
jgi:hypothetical protein